MASSLDYGAAKRFGLKEFFCASLNELKVINYIPLFF